MPQDETTATEQRHRHREPPYQPRPEQMKLWPEISGNDINGLGDRDARRPRVIFWRRPSESITHGQVQEFFWSTARNPPVVDAAWERRLQTLALPMPDVAPRKTERTPGEWAELVKKAALDGEADDVGICAYKEEWTYDDRPVPKLKWAIVFAVSHDYDTLKKAPHETTYAEVIDQYTRSARVSKHVTTWIRNQGWEAEAKTGPLAEDILMIPTAIAAGLGELGKHGSMIHRKFGANFRLSVTLTDLPLVPDQPGVFGANLFCESCQVCVNECPPDAIFPTRQWVRGEPKWYVDFDRCLPYFIENQTCGICLAACPWSRPGVAQNLARKMARRLKKVAGETEAG